MKRSVILFALVYSIGSYSQEPVQKRINNSQFQKGNIMVKWTPTSLIGISPAIQLAGEYFYSSKSSLQLEYGWINSKFDLGDLSYRNTNGHRIRIEQRNYFSKNRRWYYAPELHAQISTYNVYEDYATMKYDSALHANVPSEIHTEDVGKRKVFVSANLKIGFQFFPVSSKRVSINIYSGLGVRYLNYKKTTSTVGEYYPIDPLFYIANRLGYNFLYPLNAVAGIQIGYKIK